jgi:hypothetical protein
LQLALHRLIEQVGYQRSNLTSLGASQSDVAEKLLSLEGFNDRGNTVVTTNPEVVALGNVVS